MQESLGFASIECMKRLVVCCDGTWNKPDNETITNVEKIARTVQSDPTATGGAYQLVYYVSGVGAGSYAADRILGGAFGFGLFHNVIAAYRFLAQNYEPGDEIFIVGFSRGAYTARSVAGMVGRVGLLTKVSLVEERLPAAVAHVPAEGPARRAPSARVSTSSSTTTAIRPRCTSSGCSTPSVPSAYPASCGTRPSSTTSQLSSQVLRARQALAVDETRMKFAPSLWEAPEESAGAPTEDERVKQVWFEGAHSDVGGGYRETGLSDTSLLWMVRQAHEAGLVFDVPLLAHYVSSGSDPVRHNPVSLMFKVDNLLLGSKQKISGNKQASAFSGGLRRLTNDRALSVRVASSAVTHFQEGGYEPANLTAFAGSTNGFAGIVEPVVALPESGVDLLPLGVPPGQGLA